MMNQLSELVRAALPSPYGYEKGFRDALESISLALAGAVDSNVLAAAVTTTLDAYGNNADSDAADGRVLVTVKGGVVEFVCDPRVDVEVFDFANFNDSPEWSAAVPAHFSDLAGPIGVPFGSPTEFA